MADSCAVAAGFDEHARRRPDAPALVWHDEEISYGELSAMASRAGTVLDHLDPREPIGLSARKSPAAVALILACLRARRPFLLPAPTLGAEPLAALFTQARCRHVLEPDEKTGAAVLDGPAAEVPAAVAPVRTAPDDVSFMLTTSGSTGLPKIVPLGRGAVGRFVEWASTAFAIGPGTTVLNYAPLNFDLCLLDVWTTLARGGRVVLVDPAQALDGSHLVEVLIRHEIHVIQAVPMFFGLLLGAAPQPPRAFSAVRHVMFTGDAIPERTLAALPALFSSARLYNIYGCTETNDSFIYEVPGGAADAGPIPIGDPLPGVRACVVGSRGEPVEGPGTGELYVSTPFQAAGYLDAGRGAGKFGPHPFGLDGRSYFRTGDIVRRDEHGRLFLVGRADRQVKVRGVAINTAEVEQVLQDHPDVLEAAVVAEPDPLAGRRLLATVRRTPGSGLNSLVLRGHCARRLPAAAIPSALGITDDPLPKTATGKIDRVAASRLHASSVAEGRVP